MIDGIVTSVRALFRNRRVMMNKIQLGFDALGLEDLHNNLLLFNQEGADDLLPNGLVAEHSTVGPVHSL